MRIIDKNHDFYDYLQDSTDTLVFDRRGSYILTKQDIAESFRKLRNFYREDYYLIVLQCSATFWLFLAKIKEWDKVWNTPIDYDVELLTKWKNYDKPNKLLDIYVTDSLDYKCRSYNKLEKRYMYDYEKLKNRVEYIKDKIDKETVYDKVELNSEKPIILKASGLSSFIDPLDIFIAIEEYFSRKKTESETTEAIGTTNDDKIVMHGFDTKTSFRGK